VAPSVGYSTEAITKGATDENRYEAREDDLGPIELLAATIVFPKSANTLSLISHCNVS